MINTSRKDEFVAAWKKYAKTIDKEPVGPDAWKAFPIGEVTAFINSHPDVRTLFREAVEEARGTPEDEAAAGLSKLFSGM